MIALNGTGNGTTRSPNIDEICCYEASRDDCRIFERTIRQMAISFAVAVFNGRSESSMVARNPTISHQASRFHRENQSPTDNEAQHSRSYQDFVAGDKRRLCSQYSIFKGKIDEIGIFFDELAADQQRTNATNELGIQR